MSKALSIHQPWAWAIIYAGKDVENRSWPTQYRGPLLIHASKARDRAAGDQLEAMGIRFPTQLPRGGVVGIVDLVDVVRDSASRWAFEGEWHWRLADPRALLFQIARGQLGLSELPITVGV